MASVTVLTADAAIDLLDGKADVVHAASHADGGADEVTLAQAQITGLVAALAAKASTAHATEHATGGTDVVTLAQSQITGLVAALAAKASTAHATEHATGGTDVVTLTQAQITGLVAALAAKASTAHASTHVTGGSDELTLTQARITNLTTDLAAKASTAHASTHASAGSDPVTLAQSQITGLVTALGLLLAVASTLASGTTTLLSSKVTADTQQRFIIDASGKMLWGSGSVAGDTNLFRQGADTLRTQDVLESEKAFRAVNTGGGDIAAFASFYTGDSIDSFRIMSDGKHEWGDGGTFSSNFYSDTGGSLKTDGILKIGGALQHQGSTVGFNNTTPISKPTVTGSRGSNAALASLCTALANLGLITNSTS